MVERLAKTRDYAVLVILLIMAIVAVGANDSLVAADPCVAQLTYPIMPTVYSYSNIPIIIPVSATCTVYYGSQLYATGNAYDVTSNIGLGSVSTVLQSINGGTTFNGQLGFNLPPSTQGHTLQLTVSIYKGQYGNVITATSETIQVAIGIQQVTTTTVTQAYPYPNQYPPPYPSVSPPNQYRNESQYQARYRNSFLLSYVAIAAILAAVIIATAGLVVYGRRQQLPVSWVTPPGPR